MTLLSLIAAKSHWESQYFAEGTCHLSQLENTLYFLSEQNGTHLR
jgi:hypothetical protein